MPETGQLVGAIALRLHERASELADTMVERIRDGGEAFDEPELRETLRASCFANLDTGLASLAHDVPFPDDIPAGARDLALLCARLDVPLAELLRAADDRGAARPTRDRSPRRARDRAQAAPCARGTKRRTGLTDKRVAVSRRVALASTW